MLFVMFVVIFSKLNMKTIKVKLILLILAKVVLKLMNSLKFVNVVEMNSNLI